ncbi:ComF family protein [Cognatiluteimonas weifangensis]|uniref:ComF family protein n=1 Tax=Cognatiluteimonas weifangensis TaxID=2303539 RepID=A0A372DQ14_9GAMM|nr:ComF family protein [Luteimonas weifangensis]RFP61402.1 ComF family protein [Luteimonas weifangensis]
MSGPVNQFGLPPVDGRWRRLGAVLWPMHCLACGERAGGGALCPACRAALPWNRQACARCALPLPGSDGSAVCGRCLRRPPPLALVRSACLYAPPLDRWLPRFKFHQDLAAGRVLAQLLAAACATAPRPQALVPVPLHRTRLRRRGYDQALELARPLARAFALPLRAELLRRTRATAPQSELHAAARRRNLRDAFAVPAAVTRPAHVALVDDVMTTGATLHAAAAALRRAGVARVDAWVCARVP